MAQPMMREMRRMRAHPASSNPASPHLVRTARRAPPRAALFRVAAAANDWDTIYTGAAEPQPFCGPVEVLEHPQGDLGRGLRATQDLSPGQLLLVDSPLVFMTADESGTLPTLEQMRERLQSAQGDPGISAWLGALDAGPQFEPRAPVPSLTQDASASGSSAGPLSEDRLASLIAVNQHGASTSDLPPSVSRGDSPLGFRGVWPRFSLVNHSCAPNADYHVIRDKLILRTSRPVAKGEEVTVSYLGSEILRPATERLLDLREGRDFACECPRCTAEMDDKYGPYVDAVQKLYTLVAFDIVPRLQSGLAEAAVADERAIAQVEEALSRLDPAIQALEQALEGVKGDKDVYAWFRASSYQAYDTKGQADVACLESALGACMRHKPPDEPQLGMFLACFHGPAQCLALLSAWNGEGPSGGDPGEGLIQRLTQAELTAMDVADCVLPASQEQLLQAVQTVARAQQFKSQTNGAEEQGNNRARQVMRLRYGPDLQEETYTRLFESAAAALTAGLE